MKSDRTHNIRIFSHLVIILIMPLLSACNNCNRSEHTDAENRERFDSLFRSAVDASRKDNFDLSDSLGQVLYSEARKSGNKTYEAYGLLAQGFYPKVSTGCDERLSMVKQAEELALSLDNDTLLSRVYNILGIYSTMYERNFSLARHYYTEAIKYAKRINANNFIISAECNIAELFHSIGDTLGHVYDLDIYRYAIETDSKNLILPSAKRCAEYYIEKVKHPERSLPYIESIHEAGGDYLYHLLRGKYYLALDSIDQAGLEFDAALQEETITPNVYLTYGKFLNRLGKYQESNDMLHNAEEAYREIGNKGFEQIETRKIMSDNYRKLGNTSLALKYLELYINGRDSVNSLRNTEEINTYKVRFEVEKKELELARNREAMKRQSITLWAVIALLTAAIGFYLFYTLRKKSMHRLIVRQQKDFLIEQASVAHDPDSTITTIEAAPTQDTETEAQKGLSKEKAAAIWNLIEHEMEDNKIYADTTVTRDIFSERVGCNHTWLSQVIKDRTGKSYLQFMNSRRIKEALKILSDPTSDITQKELAAKIGFLSASTFYSTFRQQVGMSPAEYRKLALSENKKTEKFTEEY